MLVPTLGAQFAPSWHRPFLRYVDPVPGAEATPPADPTPDPAPPAPAAPPVQNVDELPDWAQKIIRDTRKEAGDNRTAKTAAEQQLAAILKAAGVGEEADPAKALEARTTERDSAAQERDTAKRELALFKAAQAAGADPSKLLDRNSFMNAIQGLDVSDATALKAAITTAITADPTLKAPRAGSASTVDNPGGTGEPGPITEEQLARMTPEQIAKAFDEGRLKHLL